VYAGSFHVATYDNGTTFFDHTDWQGTERVRSNVTGVSALTCTNLPYGDNQSCVGPLDPSPQHFTGKMRDPETGLDYFGARYYSSGTARWMLPDWSAVPEAVPYADISNPQSLNLYTYVGNNPINGVDADGHADDLKCGQVGMQGPGTGGQGGGALGQVACSSPVADLVTSNATQLASDTIAGAVKGIANTAIDMSNALNKPIDAALSNFTDFQFGQTPEFQGSTPGQNSAMAGIFAIGLLTPEGDEAAVTKYQGLVADAEEKYPKLAGKFQDHHIIPKYLGGDKDGA
jgi:RHS repeat-associated protein